MRISYVNITGLIPVLKMTAKCRDWSSRIVLELIFCRILYERQILEIVLLCAIILSIPRNVLQTKMEYGQQ